jgi:hypothetical protein
VVDRLDVRGERHLQERRTDGIRRQVLEDAADRRDGRLVGRDQQQARRTGRELDAAEVLAAARPHQHQAVAHGGPRRPARTRARATLLEMEHQVDDQPGVDVGSAYFADGVRAHVPTLRGGDVEPGGEPRLVGAREGRQLAGVVREHQLDPLVEQRPVDAEVGERRGAELHAHVGRREALDGDDLDLVEDHRQAVAHLGAAGHRTTPFR